MIERGTTDYTADGPERFCTPPCHAPVGLRHFVVTDSARADVDGRPRRFPVSAFYPAESVAGTRARIVDSLEPRLADALLLLTAKATPEDAAFLRDRLPSLTFQALRDAPPKRADAPCPTLLFYPGGEATRLSNVAVCEQLAVLGYVVVTVDAPRDAPVVVYPDGDITIPPMADDESYITPRVADVRILLDDLTSPAFSDEISSLVAPERIGMFGASRGGYLSNICAVEDARIRAAANMDGFLWGFWTDGTGLDQFPLDFQRRARAMTTPILRLIAEQENEDAAQTRFLLEKEDFGGSFTLAALNGFTHGAFGTTHYLTRQSGNAVETLRRRWPPCPPMLGGSEPEVRAEGFDSASEPPSIGGQGGLLTPSSHALTKATQTCVGLLDAFFRDSLTREPTRADVVWPALDGFLYTRVSSTFEV